MAFTLAPLPYPYDGLEPFIDAETMHFHHDKHHQSYIDNLNKALEDHPELANKSIEQLLTGLHDLPESIQTAVRNHGGGHANHQLFWKIMKPGGGGRAGGALGAAIDQNFGSFEKFQQGFEKVGTGHFGSGWVFLVTNPKEEFKLEILSLPNQDSVLLVGKPALLGNDLWEHSYYLKYQNRRAEYLKAWWNVIAWDVVEFRFEAIRADRSDVLGGPNPRTHF
jgi:superoxide dismutase, Fe-Mn family